MQKLTTIMIVCLLILATMPISVMASIVSPETITAELDAGETENDKISVVLPPTSPKGDVVFIFDSTGSMSGQLNAMENKAVDIMKDIRLSVPDTNFGVGSFVDYPHTYNSYGYYAIYGSGPNDYAWRMDHDLTSSTADVHTAIDNLEPLNGVDTPQDYARALYESQFFSWRSDAKKIVVIIGDAPPHAAPGFTVDPTGVFRTGTYGGDPGRDEIMGNADDLDFKTVVQSLADNNIVVIAVDCSESGADDATRAFQYEADQTGGLRFDYTSGTIAADIVAKINTATSAPITKLTVNVREAAYASWVVVTPTEYTNVPWGATKQFDVAITPPEGTAPGPFTIHLDVLGDGVVLGTTTINKTITMPSPEFPSLALPIGMILGFVFITYSLRSRKEN